MLEKFSSSYGATKDNFVIISNFNNDNNADRRDFAEYYSVLCVVQNILQRGNRKHPTPPSRYLKKVLGELTGEPTYLLSSELAHWGNIKGDPRTKRNPALTFFDDLLLTSLNEDYAIRNLIMPEVSFSDILGDNTKFGDQHFVDFYFPQLKTAIEIDGIQHKFDKSQRQKDADRDRELTTNGIDVVRINAEDINNNTPILASQIDELKNKIAENEDINAYKKALAVTSDDIRVQYDSVMRLQMLILSLLKRGIYKFDEKSVITAHIAETDVPNIQELFEYAYKDLSLWVEHICALLRLKVIMPEISWVSREIDADIIINYSIFKRWTDKERVATSKTVYIRNDYFYKEDFYKIASAETLEYKFDINSTADKRSISFLLKNIFGFSEFRQGQLPIIANILSGRDTIGILPTGTGKSLCYQLSALLQPGVSIVVVPIIALMDDQVRTMRNKRIGHIDSISSSISGEERANVQKMLASGKYHIILVTPERFQDKEFRAIIQEVSVKHQPSLAIIDEVHCLSEWGHDFRVSYLALIPTIREYCPKVKILGLTATASQAVLKDLKAGFGMSDSQNVKAAISMDRDELVFKKVCCTSDSDKRNAIRAIINQCFHPYTDDKGKTKQGVGIIFCPTANGRNFSSCRCIDNFLRGMFTKEALEMYHSQKPLSAEDKKNAQERFMRDDFSGIMVCTKAFGMGIDKENIKFTIHSALPESMEAFYQETGRAGRDAYKKEKSHCYILYMPEPMRLQSTINEIFNLDTDIDKRKELCKDLNEDGDLRTRMHFWNQDRHNIQEEYEDYIFPVLSFLYRHGNNKVVSLKFDNSKEQLRLVLQQKVLYKLAILGIVGTWTIVYHNLEHGTIEVSYNDLDIGRTRMKLERYIQKYDSKFRIDNLKEEDIYNKTLQQEPNKPIKACVCKLIDWNNKNIENMRLQSLQTMLEVCSDKVSDEDFRKRMSAYFKYDDDTLVFNALEEDQFNYSIWFEILGYDSENNIYNVIEKNKAEELLALLARYLESYATNIAFNYLSGMLRLICGRYKGTEGEWRLRQSIEYIVNYYPDKQDYILKNTLLIAKIFAEDEQNMLSEELCKIFPLKVGIIYEELHDIVSAAIMLEKGTLRVKKKLEVSLCQPSM